MSLPRVLLVEDDASLQRFVSMALEELPIELLIAGSVSEALAVLAAQPVILIITDLMLPDRSGIDLLADLVSSPALRGSALLAAFSAGLRPEVRERLNELHVWRMISKPCGVADIEGCVRDALALHAGTTPTAPPTAPAAMPTPGATATQADGVAPAMANAIAGAFGGSAELYHAFRAACLLQFPADLSTGDDACAQGDAQALRRLAHSLKSVLLTLGHPAESALARELEDMAHAGRWAHALPMWQRLRGVLQTLR